VLYTEEFTSIGLIRKGHGHQGHARVEIEEQYLEHFLSQDFLFLEVDGYKVPFRIEEHQQKQHLLIKLRTIDSPEALVFYHLHSIYLLQKEVAHLVHEPKNDQEGSGFIGMEIRDRRIGTIGTIIRIEAYPQQIMAFVEYGSKEIMLPLHDSLILEVDQENGIVKMELPDGLLQL